ncbi:MAG: hypothetical protein OXC31_06195, partial [Spirochaetaceae bacterium]|nr:hypothetical protein [Spirochaetaceae bacterium]
LTARFAGRDHTWTGRIVRTEGEIDPRTRMVNAIAQVQDPYGRDRSADRPPLAIGMFVHAAIEGIVVRDVVKAPRSALRGDNTVYVIDSANRLAFREVDILRLERESVLVRGGVEEGERICISPLEAAVNGMQVMVTENGAGPGGSEAATRGAT